MRYVTATIEGQTYKIPAMWMVGFRGSPIQAVRHWHEQAQMQAEVEAQRPQLYTSFNRHGQPVRMTVPTDA